MPLLGVGLCWHCAASAQTREVHLDLRPGPLSRAINEIAAQAGASIGTDDPARLRRLIDSLRLDGPVERALRRTLAGTGLRAVQTGPSSWRIVNAANGREQSRPAPAPIATDEILVTGSKQAVPLARYPGSVTLIEGRALDKPGRARGTLALAEMHATLLSTRLGPGRNKLFLRGIADSSFNGTSPALVGQYLGDLRLTYASPDPDLRLYDVAQVEILEGPQGTLYGAGSLGGILRIVPRAPDPVELSGEAWTGASRTRHGQSGADGGLIANVPLGERLALRLLGYAETNGGYIDDIARGRRDVNSGTVAGGRAALRADLGGAWAVTLSGIAQDVHNQDAQYADAALGRLRRASPVAQPSHHLYRAADLSIEGAIGDAALRSTTGLVRQHLGQTFDATQPGGDVLLYRQRDSLSLLTNETRLNGQMGPGLEWVAGLAALRATSSERRALGSADAPADLGEVRLGVTEATLFGELAMPFRAVRFTLGVRVSRTSADGSATGALAKPSPETSPALMANRVQWLNTPTAGILWQATRLLSLFARYAGGYRPGGLTINGVAERFEPDTIRTIETGLRLQGDRIHLSASAATSTWRNIQADTLDGLAIPHVANIGDGRVESLSMALGWDPVAGLALSASGFLNHSKLVATGQSVDGVLTAPLPNVARYGAVVSAEYDRAIDSETHLGLGLRAQTTGPSLLGVGPQLALRQGDYAVVSASASLKRKRLTMSLDATNLLDRRGNLFALGTPFTLATSRQRTPLRPRTVRLGLRAAY